MNYIFVLITFVLLLFNSDLFGQNNVVNFYKGEKEFESNILEFTSKKLSSYEIFQNRFYRFVQFNEIPNIAQQEQIRATGIQLLEYIPNKLYVASIPVGIDIAVLKNLNIRSIVPIERTYKISQRLEDEDYPSWAKEGEFVKVIIRYHQDISPSLAKAEMKRMGINVQHAMDHAQMIVAQLLPQEIEKIAGTALVRYIDLISEPGKPESDVGRHLHRANAIDGEFYGARNYDGTGVSIAINDDGFVGPHIDFKGRANQQEVAGDFTGSHGDMVAGIAGGAGNLNPLMRGMATGSYLHIRQYDAAMPGTIPLHQDSAVLVFCSSYSNGCNAGYTNTTALVDQEIYNNPTLIQVFSAGNSNNQNCGYGAGNQWGNITGGHKMGKNVIATANLDANDTIVNSSSRGPASDGRIKPDIAAHGAGQMSTDPNNVYSPGGGTSAAAPGITGVMAQLHHAYRNLNGGATAPSALLKAALLNTATDLGNDGPDFIYGWGKVNGLRAVQLLEDNRYLSGTLVHGDSNSHSISIPVGVQRAKIMVYWADREASTAAATALVNDLDATVVAPNTGVHLPWLLNHTPNPTTLALPATKGVDHLNNVEEIAIDNPTAGTYTLKVKGTTIPMGTQDYFVVYEFLMEDITVVYPMGGEGLIPGSNNRIYWDAYGNSGTFLIEYTVDNGNSWITIEAAEPGASRFIDWTVPTTVTGAAKVRVSRAGISGESVANFNIIDQVPNLRVNLVCPTTNTIGLVWDSVPGAIEYDVFMLGSQYMDSIGTTTTLNFDLTVADINNEAWFSVRARGQNGLVGLRANAILYEGFGVDQGCYIACGGIHDVGIKQFNMLDSVWGYCDLSPKTLSVELFNEGYATETTIPIYYQLGSNPIVTETYTGTLSSQNSTTFSFINSINIPTPGTYELKVWTGLTTDARDCNDTLRQMIIAIDTLPSIFPIEENFDNGVFPESFAYVIDVNNDVTWDTINVIGASGSVTTVMKMNNEFFNYGYEERSDIFGLSAIDLTSGIAGAAAQLIFDVSYRPQAFGTEASDDLRIDYSIDCGQTFHQLYFKDGLDLSTSSSRTQFWMPSSASDWRREYVDLTPLIGNDVLLRFVNIPGHFGTGNDLYIDNINIEFGTLSPIADFSSDVVYSCDGQVSFKDESGNQPTQWLWNFGDGNTSTQANPRHTYTSEGVYSVSLEVTNGGGTNTVTRNGYVEVKYPEVLSTQGNTVCQDESARLRAYGNWQTNLHWYDSGNNLLYVGTDFNTPLLDTTTTYQVKSVYQSPIIRMGPTDPTAVGATSTTINGGYAALNFTAETDFYLVSVWVEANSAGPRTIELWDGFNGNTATNTLLESKTINLVGGGQRVALAFEVPAAGNYSLVGANMDLVSNTAGVSYPYTITDVVSIVSAYGGGAVAPTTNTSSYNYFYDWEIRLDFCESAPTNVTADVIASFSTSVSGNTATFSSNPNASLWFWVFGDGSISTQPNPVHVYSALGTYEVTLSMNINGISCSFRDTVIVTTIVDVPKIENTIGWNIQPNPTTETTVLKFNAPLKEDYQVEVIGVGGNVLINESIPEGKTQISLDVSRLNPAVYFVRLISNKGIEVKKLLIQH